MKILVGLFTFLVALILSVYVMIFTSFGQSIILPIAQESIEKTLKIDDAKFTKFSLNTNSIDTTLTLNNHPITIKGDFDIFKQFIKLSYDIKIDDISIFNKISNQKLQGSFHTNGKVTGVVGDIKVAGVASFADGKTDYSLLVKENDITDIMFTLNQLSIEKLLYMVSQPQYTKGKLNIAGKISSLNNLNGDIVTKITDGILNSAYINKTFEQKLPNNAKYQAIINTKLAKEKIISIVDFDSFVAQLDTKKTVFNLTDGSLNTDYILDIPSLNDLQFITNQKLKGGITIDGDVKFNKTLKATFNSNKFDGTLKGKLDNNKLTVKLDNIQSTKLLDMLYYPMIFKSNIKLDLDYDIASKKGLSKLSTTNGQFLTNQTTELLKKFTSYDLTMEVYDITNLTTKIDDTNLDSELYMKSKNSEIKSKIFKIDTAKSTINANLNLKYRKYDMGLELTEDLTNPKVKLNAGKVLETKAKEKAKEKIKEKLGDKLKDKIGDKQIGNLLDKLF